MDQEKKISMKVMNHALSLFAFRILFSSFLEEKPFAVLEHIVMKRFKHSKKLLLNHVSNLDIIRIIGYSVVDLFF